VRPLGLADSDKVVVGDPAIAIGNPFGLDRTATEGIISALERQITAPNGFGIDDAIQTDAPINPGNSGGPLLNAAGQVVGINSQILTGGSGNGNVGVGFAVPSNTVREVVPRLQRGETIARPYLGLSTAPGPNGATVGDVVPGGPSARSGLREGDVVKRVDGGRIADPADVAAAIADRKPGDRVDVVVERAGQEVDLSVELGTRPATRTP
jgi:putative serine protease PepD